MRPSARKLLLTELQPVRSGVKTHYRLSLLNGQERGGGVSWRESGSLIDFTKRDE